MNQKRIGEFIAQCRKDKKITQEELARVLGVSNKTISRWENGINMPDYSILKPLANELNISINELFSGCRIKKDKIIQEYENNLVNVLKEYKRMKKSKTTFFIISCVFLYFIFLLIAIIIIPKIISENAKVFVNDEIAKYNEYIGPDAQDEYKNKFDMDESIFPPIITDDMSIEDYKMVYYNPWDAQYISYIVVQYNDSAYQEEIERLVQYDSTEYLGNYGVTGFTKYK